ncbi:MAG TPA: PRC-barrel domain-containing protein [Candidatus Paceibacterota bacterium]|nr:PRC-barrel domain-containing protein [Candidatus Paceibacterota bacterium]
MLKIKKISEVLGKKVFTDEGNFFGEIEEVNLVNNKIESWRIRLKSGLNNVFSGARGVIIPHNYVRSIGDVFVISQTAVPAQSNEEMPEFA